MTRITEEISFTAEEQTERVVNDSNLTKLSRFLSFVLRHKPEAIDIVLDQNGWADVDVLINAVNRSKQHFINRVILDEIVTTDDKQRYVFNSDKKLIRASQGHSVDIDLKLKIVMPPEFYITEHPINLLTKFNEKV